MSFALQATRSGWYTHGMVGFDHDRAFAELDVPQGYRVECAVALGHIGDKATLPEMLQAREQPNDRQTSRNIGDGRQLQGLTMVTSGPLLLQDHDDRGGPRSLSAQSPRAGSSKLARGSGVVIGRVAIQRWNNHEQAALSVSSTWLDHVSFQRALYARVTVAALVSVILKVAS